MKRTIPCVALFLVALLKYETMGTPVQWTVSQGGNGHFYEPVQVPSGISWSEAKREANRVGGYLATPTTSAENDFVFGLIDSSGFWIPGAINEIGPWLGGVQVLDADEPNGNWQWITGEPWSYTNWQDGSPNDGGDQGFPEQYLRYYSSSPIGRMEFWDDGGDPEFVGGSMHGYIIEYDSIPPDRLVRNGSFEYARATGEAPLPGVIDANTGADREVFGPPTESDPIYVLGDGSLAVADWLAISRPEDINGDGVIDLYPTIDWVHSANYAASDGERSIDLNGTPGPGGIAQYIDVIEGHRYRLTFDLAGNPRGLGDPNDPESPPSPPSSFTVTMIVDADGATHPFAFTVDGAKTPMSVGWERESWEFTAVDGQLLLQFLSTTPRLYNGLSADFGPVIDDVSLVDMGIAGDFNDDSSVDASDAGVMFGNWGGRGTGDLNGDGIVDAADAGELFAAWTGDTAAVPEPNSLLLGTLGTFGTLLVRRRRSG